MRNENEWSHWSLQLLLFVSKKKVITIDGYKSITVKHWVILGENVKLIRPKKKRKCRIDREVSKQFKHVKNKNKKLTAWLDYIELKMINLKIQPIIMSLVRI